MGKSKEAFLASGETLADIRETSIRCRELIHQLSDDDDLDDRVEARELMSGFNNWAANMGVFREGQQSLTYRLGSAPQISELVQQLLVTLQRDLDDDEVLSRSPPRSTIWTSMQGTMASLQQLALTIRIAGTGHRQERIQRFKNLDRNKQVCQLVEDCARQMVDFRFPKASECLRERMAESIATRRARFLYLEQHQKKTSILNEPSPEPQQIEAPEVEEDTLPIVEPEQQKPATVMVRDQHALQDCPFCGGFPEEIEKDHPDRDGEQAREALQKHVRDHLVSAALILAPMEMEEPGSELDGTQSDAQKGTDSTRNLNDFDDIYDLECRNHSCDCKEGEKNSPPEWSTAAPDHQALDITKMQMVTQLWKYILDEKTGHQGEDLIKHGFDVNNEIDGHPPLHEATDGAQFEAMRLLLHQDADPNIASHNQNTVLIAAMNLGNKDIVAHLLANGADVNGVGQSGQTALHQAAALSHAEIVRLLLEQPDTDIGIRDNNGYTALMVAAWTLSRPTQHLFM
ncbi:hypothetical protein Neosp_009539 [[Neocosmospora] mangrovei]